ncbi:ferredoxin reductase-like protein [Backusella circina FSU 941]|nr:ferredoxin reductase-like protein [Backusella circina FSU 941]
MDSIQSLLPYLIPALAAAGTAYYFANRKSEVLDAKVFKKFKLSEKIVISHNTAIYRFNLPRKDAVLGLPIGQHVSVMAEINGKQISRSYTPTTSDEDRGHFDLLIKSYPSGNISRHFGELKIGDEVSMKGPKGNFNYTPNMCSAIGMIAGGTGITPMLQIIHAILRNPNDKTKVNLIFGNVTEEDILLREELEQLAKDHDNFNVFHVLNAPPQGWTQGTGFVTADMIREHCPAPASDIKVLLCGPLPMVKAMSENLTELGYDKPRAVSQLQDQVFKF